jgi:hypothetical protein
MPNWALYLYHVAGNDSYVPTIACPASLTQQLIHMLMRLVLLLHGAQMDNGEERAETTRGWNFMLMFCIVGAFGSRA